MTFQQYPQKGGIPSGTTAQRPSSPVSGDTYYNGETGLLEIYTVAGWQPCSAPSGTPAIIISDLGSSRSYADGPAFQVDYTPSNLGGFPIGYTASATSAVTANVYSGTTTSTTVVVTTFAGSTGYGASYNVSASSYNGFGSSPYVTGGITVTTKPEAPTIGTATSSAITSDVAVTWTNGATGGKVISSIKINAYISGTLSTSQTAATTSATSHTFTGLTANTSYTFKVYAVNSNGDGALSSATNSVTIPDLREFEWLVIAGGGAGGDGLAAGGGAGGYRTGTSLMQKGVALTCTVGAGGAASNTTQGYGNFGVASSITGTGFTAINASRGGGGGYYSDNPGRPGGSGGGGGGNGGGTGTAGGTGNEGGYSPVEGYNGGRGTFQGGSKHFAGGGGGSSAVGGDTASNKGGNGGAGTASSITGTSVTRAGGGGGAGRWNESANGGDGGSGGGGKGSGSWGQGEPGTANTGSGGGGGMWTDRQTSDAYGFSGGSGVIIVRALSAAASTTGSPTSGTTGSYTYYVFNGTGTITW